MHLVKNEDVSKMRPVTANFFSRQTQKVLPVRTKGVPTGKFLIETANNYIFIT